MTTVLRHERRVLRKHPDTTLRFPLGRQAKDPIRSAVILSVAREVVREPVPPGAKTGEPRLADPRLSPAQRAVGARRVPRRGTPRAQRSPVRRADGARGA
ncbi:hypothetical protein GCM10009609_23110 [Pseudonocardia aurantiaca]